MRKFSASLLAISFFIISLCGCENGNKQLTLCSDFEATAVITTADITMKADVISASKDDVSITVQSPENLKGLCYHKVNSTLYIEYDGLKCTTAPDYLPSFNPFDVVFDAMSCLYLAQPESSQNNDKEQVFVGDTPHGKVELYADENGNITNIAPKYTDCKIELSYQ